MNDLYTKQAQSLYDVIRDANKRDDVSRLRVLERDLMCLQDKLDQMNLKRFDRINHGFDFEPSHSKGSGK